MFRGFNDLSFGIITYEGDRMSIDYELKTLKKTLERRLMFLEMTLIKINTSIQALEIEIRKKKSDIMTYHGADPQNKEVDA